MRRWVPDGNPCVLEPRIELNNSSIVHDFQLVNKQMNIPCDGILGRDFFQRTRAKLCYESRTVALKGETCKMVGETNELQAKGPNMRKIDQIKLPPRAENIVRVPVTPGSPLVGMTNKCEIQGVILAASLRKVVYDYVMKIILNTDDTEVDMQKTLVQLDEVDAACDRSGTTEFEFQDSERF